MITLSIKKIVRLKSIKICLCYLFLVFSSLLPLTNASASQTRETLLAVYTFRLAENIQWKNASRKNRYHFHIIDDNYHVYDHLQDIAKIRKLHNKNIHITHGSTNSIPANPEVIFVANNKANLYEDIFAQTENQNTLLITDNLSIDRISLIDLREKHDNSLYFQINKANIINRDLGLNPDIILLGGTEIDVAQLYREGLQNLQAQSKQLSTLKSEIELLNTKSTQLHADLDKAEKEEARLIKQLNSAEDQINQQHQQIEIEQQNIEEKKAEVDLLKTKVLEIQDVIDKKNKTILEASEELALLQTSIEDKTLILDAKQKSLMQKTDELKQREITINYQKYFLFLLSIIGILSTFLLVLTYRHYRNKQKANIALKQHTDELTEAKKVAEYHTQAKSMFLSNMSHELRSPLNAIIGFSNLIYSNPNLPDGIKEHSKIIAHSGDHLLTLINDVLDMAKIESGKIDFLEEDIHFFSLLKDVENMSKILAKQKDLELIFDYSSACPCYLRTDASKLRRIFINLISNAIKYTEKGGVAVRVKCDTNADTNMMKLSCEVEDSGMGIPENELDNIFRPFERKTILNQDKTLPGAGLGLSITKELVEAMQGSISVESTPGSGSVFRFEVSVSKVSSESVKPINMTRKLFVGVKPGQRTLNVLIVEDLEDNLQYLQYILESCHCNITSATNGKEAIEQFKKFQPDLIFMDRRMPIMGGIEATQFIRSLPGGNQVKIIAVTASVFREDQEDIMQQGFDDFIRKPYLAEEIHDCITKHFNIEFIYQDYPEESTEENNKITIDADEFNQVSQQDKIAIRSAVLALDVEKTVSIIEAMKTNQPQLAKKLQTLVENYNFGYLRSIVNNIEIITKE